MKRAILATILVAVLGVCQAADANKTKSEEERTMSIQKTYQFIKDAKTYYLATVEKDQPRVRPFGTIHIFEGKLYIQTGRKKNVAQQLLANGKAEICAFKDGKWIRVSGVLVDDPRREAKASMLSEYESLKKIGYSPDDENTMVLYFQPGTVTSTIYSFTNPPEVMTF